MDWIFVLDLASIHRAADFRAKVPDHIHIVHIPAQATSYCQPCGLAYTISHKMITENRVAEKIVFRNIKKP